MLNKKALAASVSAPPAEYVEDVFSTYLYTGNGSTQSITNGIDLAGKGGMTWFKGRNTATSHALFDTNRGAGYSIYSNATSAQSYFIDDLSAFNSNGFSLGDSATSGRTNASGYNYCSWTFRKQPKFFDVVTATSSGGVVTFNHNLGVAPGMVIVKGTNGTDNWITYHRSLGTNQYIFLNNTGAAGTYSGLFTSTSTQFSVNSLSSPTQYVAYLFAHDAGGFGAAGTDNVISCGSFSTDGATTTTVNLGYEPQYLLVKLSNGTDGWYLLDVMRGLTTNISGNTLSPNSSSAEVANSAYTVSINATGFTVPTSSNFNNLGQTYIYMAIRRGPMKTPTSGTSVFSPSIYTGTLNTSNPNNRMLPATDLWLNSTRNTSVTFYDLDRLRGWNYLATPLTNAENASYTWSQINQTTLSADWWNSSQSQVDYYFRRAPGFMDIVCYTGTGTATTVTHNLGVVPELIIVKSRSNVLPWNVYCAPLGAGKRLRVNTTDASQNSSDWNSTTPTSSVFSVGSFTGTNGSGQTHVAYLFASLAGVSKVGSYTGNGSNQTINCGFTAGARFVLIKRTDSTGDWVTFDTARGIVSGNDPFLQLNTTDAEVTGEDAVDPTNSGFIVNETTEALNTNNATYIYLAIA